MKGLWALAMLTMGCGPQMVQGSLSAVLKLDYQKVQAGNDGTHAAIKFTSPQGAGVNIVLEVAAQVSDLILVPGSIINLAENGPDGTQRGVVSRDVVNDPWKAFPLIALGSLQLNGLITSGAHITGNFNVTFVEGTTQASGHTAFSNFTAEVP
jgi:hypothetical protein